MKFGTLTFHNVNNYGARLQAYALQKFIEKNGFESEIINFSPNSSTNKKERNTLLKKIYNRLFNIKSYKNKKEKIKLFDQFSSRYMKISSTSYKGDESMERNPLHYDGFIVGSDQIWNTEITNNSKAYFLNFVENEIKISYAASFGKEDFNKDEENNISNFLNKFDSLSVREINTQKILKEQYGIKSIQVLDPVFLLNKNEWKSIANSYDLPKKYILVYVLEYSEEMFDSAISLGKEIGCEVFYISLIPQVIKGNILTKVGPQEFISVLNNATYIFTNSFHGTAFSILLEKQFSVVRHSTKNSRIDSILSIANLKSRYIDSKEVDLQEIDYIKVNNELKPYIHMSQEYLIGALNSRKKTVEKKRPNAI